LPLGAELWRISVNSASVPQKKPAVSEVGRPALQKFIFAEKAAGLVDDHIPEVLWYRNRRARFL
jgi:hypothetical protein